MKKTNLILVLLLFSTSMIAQNFAAVNTTWHFSNWSWDEIDDSFFKVVADRDTTIDNKYVTILEMYANGEYIPEARLFIHETDDKVYFFEENDFHLLYDFNLEVGDTLFSNIPTNRNYYDIATNNFAPSSVEVTQMIVDSISYLTVENVELKTLHTRESLSPDNENCLRYGAIHERLGSRNGLFGQSCMQLTVGWSGRLRCYSDNDIFYQPVSIACESGFNNTTEVRQHSIDYYPNPVNDIIHLSGDKTYLLSSYKIYDFSGLLISEGEILNRDINLTTLSKGIYWLQLIDKNDQSIDINKIIKR
ncbi:MAG: T9SS type A sorting domain-containing protein [Saprospiraceae bacterium]